jgi:hypothetical protein
MLTQSELKRIWHYDPLTGLFTRLVAGRAPNTEVGSIANCHSVGYINIQINNRLYGAHVLAHFYMTGKMPIAVIDHRDGVRDNNAWSNLRDVTQSINLQNQRRPPKNNTSGYVGVIWSAHARRWKAQIVVDKKYITLGYFECKHEAGEYRLQKKRELHLGCTI